MSFTVTAIVLLAGGTAQFPDTLDHLRAGDVVPQVGLLLDRSCSMGGGHLTTDCPWYSSTYLNGGTSFNKNHQMKSTLIGCKTSSDGIIDLWAGRVNFSVYEFGSAVRSWQVPFDSDKRGARDPEFEGIPVDREPPTCRRASQI